MKRVTSAPLNLELKCVYFLSLNSHFDKAVYLLNQMELHLHSQRLNIHFYLFAFKTWRKFYYAQCLKNTIQIMHFGSQCIGNKYTLPAFLSLPCVIVIP